MDEKTSNFFRLEDLRIYGKAVDYNKWVINALREPDNEGERRLCGSYINSSLDIALNIIEGSSNYKNHFEDFLKVAKTAIHECVFYTTVSHKLGLLTEEQEETSRELLMEMTRMIGALIVSLTRNNRQNHDNAYEAD